MARTKGSARPFGRHTQFSSEEHGRPSQIEPSELPDELIQFVLKGSSAVCEPPRKRQKLMVEGHQEEEVGKLDSHIVVRQSSSSVRCEGSKLNGLDLPLTPSNVKLHAPDGFKLFKYAEILDEKRRPLHKFPFPDDAEGFEDVKLAVEVDHESKKWAKGEGKVWSEFGILLLERDGVDYLQITCTIKWNVTHSLYGVPRLAKKIPSLSRVLSTYFPDPNAAGPEPQLWSPQDFYQSAKVPGKKDEESARLQTTEVEATLYPFQRRAVQWLLRREGVEWSAANSRIQNLSSTKAVALPISFVEAKDACGQICYVSHLFGIVTLDATPFHAIDRDLHGGILAEEMGLGKTLEIISLITLHKRPLQPPTVFDAFIGEMVRPTRATLIVSPPSILQQWISEINKHTPHLKAFHYEGIKGHEKMTNSDLVECLATSDVVVTTYSVLAAEIHYTQLNPEKSLRRESKYPRPKSPIMQLSWWRVCIDEAQMIESGVSNAAVVARMIPRINCWAITGTPVRKDVNDLHGLLIFLRCEPYATAKHVWSSLISSHKHEFRRLFGTLALRHSKRSVRNELKLPAQRRYIITMPFTPIEEQHYQELYSEMCEALGVDLEGAPLVEDWSPGPLSETMRNWLVRLRQTALHPKLGRRNRVALGNNEGPLRTVDQVLAVMMENTDLSIRTDQRGLLTSKLKRGQFLENSPRVKEALDIWDEVAHEALAIVDECREQLRQEMGGVIADGKSTGGSREVSDNDGDVALEHDDDPTSRLGIFRNRLRGALEIEHMAIFFRANAYFQIKSNEDMTKPGSPEFQSLEKLETDGYEEAKKLRREILHEIFRKAENMMKGMSCKAASQSFVQIPEFPTNLGKGGLESRRIMEQLGRLASALDAQANQLDEWREQTIQFLLRPLVDEDEGVEITGDEYEESTKTQDEVMVYVQAVRTVIADRHFGLTGQENELVNYDVKIALRLAKANEGVFPEKTIELLNVRQHLKPTHEMGSVRGIVAELRALSTSLRLDAEGGSSRAQSELFMVEKQLQATQKQLSEQTKATVALEKEIELFTSVMNTRLEYYRQLQQISDMVSPYQGPRNDRVVARMVEDEEKLTRKIAAAKSKKRYLVHLSVEAGQEQRICVICRETFEVGALTVCGHQYCKECIRIWWHSHHNCPICKKKLIQADLYEVTYKPQELSIQTEEVHEVAQQRASPSFKARKSAIYSEISQSKLAEIKNIDLDGPSFTTKVDTLARHLIWLRESDPGAKSIIYSQFKDFLDVLARAFKSFRIGFSSIDKPNGIEKFKNDPGIECFLLHARAHSSGLNLVNASHVFLCEPLLNTALELQAIARVDRIGQHQETNVWLYLVDGTVEESIHQLSVKRRMEHIGHSLSKGKGKANEIGVDEFLDSNLEEANSMELQQASLTGLLAKGGKGGENIQTEDLWDCLFGVVSQKVNNRTLNNHDLRFDPEVRRHIAAEAAEGRLASN